MFMNGLGILPVKTGFLRVFSILVVMYGIPAWSQSGDNPAKAIIQANADSTSSTEPEPPLEEPKKMPVPVQSQEAEKMSEAVPVLDEPSSPSASVTKPTEPQDTPRSSLKKYFSIHGQLRNETAYRIASPKDISKIKNFAYVEMTGKFSQHLSYDLSTRMYCDAAYDISSTFSQNVKRDQQWDAELRNAFVDIGFGPLELRLGKQQVVWGQAVNLFFADVVNPKDLREFVLPDLDDMRMPMWTADVEFFFGNTHMELVGIPVLDHNKIGASGSDFASQIPSLPSNAVLNSADIKIPANNLRNGVYGFRLSRLMKGWDLGGFYLYGYDYSPTFFRHIEADPDTKRLTVNITPEMTRKRTVGATFSKDVNGLIFKGEFVYDKGRHFIVTDPADMDGVVKSNYFEYLLGFDYTFFGKVDFNYQFFQQFVLNSVETLLQDDKKSFSSIWLKTGFFDNRLEPEFFFVSNLTKPDYMVRPKLNYKFNSYWRGALGTDLFGGDHSGDFGQFENANRVYLELRRIF